MVVLVAVAVVVQHQAVVMARPDSPALVQDKQVVQAVHPTVVQAVQLLVQILQVDQEEIPHIQVAVVAAAVVLVEIPVFSQVVLAELVLLFNRHPIVQWPVLVAVVVVHTGPMVLRVQAVYMAVAQAEQAILVVRLLVLKAL
jgi:hypothetical protein